MSLRTALAHALTVLSFIAGIVASFRTGDWTCFSRSGAAVVAIGIVLTSRQILEHNRRLQAFRRRRPPDAAASRSNPADPYPGDWAGEQSIRELIRSRSREEESWKTEFNGLYMLVVGTLVWGFGDLLGLVAG